jgi:hypothetical protein
MSELETTLGSNQDGIININLLEPIGFGGYLISVGMRASEFAYSKELIFNNQEYFKKCFDKNLSAYKALLFLHDDLIYRRGSYS